MKEIPWNLISPVVFVLMGVLVVSLIGVWPETKEPAILLLGAILTRIKIPSK